MINPTLTHEPNCSCRLCWLFENDARYRARWSNGQALDSRLSTLDPLSCRHRGAELREQKCETCAGATRIKVFACDVHGECSIAKDVGVKVCRTCGDRAKDDELPEGAIVIDANRNGFGDAMITAWISEGSKGTDRPLIHKAQYAKAELLTLFNQTVVTNYVGPIVTYEHTYSGELSKRGKVGRIEWRQRAITAAGTPNRPRYLGDKFAEAWARTLPDNIVVLFPDCENQTRRWPMNYWADLYGLLTRSGLSPCFVTHRDCPKEMTGVKWLTLKSWGRICELLRRCKFAIGLDSGPAHVAATMEIPFLCIVGPTIHRGGFEYATTLDFISVSVHDIPCVGCYWSRQFRQSCNLGCEALMRLRAIDVFMKAMELYAVDFARV